MDTFNNDLHRQSLSKGNVSPKLSNINVSIFYWDGSDIGDIDQFVHPSSLKSLNSSKLNSSELFDNDIKVWASNDVQNVIIKVRLQKYNTKILISEEIKELFGIPNFNVLQCNFKGKKYILTYTKGDMELSHYFNYIENSNKTLSSFFIEEVRRLIAFKYLISGKSHHENAITVRFKTLRTIKNIKHSFDEHSYPVICIDDYDLNNTDEPSECLITKWFSNSIYDLSEDRSNNKLSSDEKDSYDNYSDYLHNFVMDKDANLLKFEIIKIINKYDKDCMYWSNSIYDRINSVKKQFVELSN